VLPSEFVDWEVVQTRPPAPQFSLGKSFPGFGPTGPWMVTPDALDDRVDLAMGSTVNGKDVLKS
jgi:2-keto-4-pentenoate hydratase/2-oxohepta-3-ene-1,7-dioic acid hydratase in catechol pathway